MPAQMRVSSGIAMDQKGTDFILEDKNTALAEEIKVGQRISFGGLQLWIANKAKLATWECVATAVNEVGRKTELWLIFKRSSHAINSSHL